MPKNRFAFPADLGVPLRALEDLIWPRQCAGCGRWDVNLCKDCFHQVTRGSLSADLEDAEGLPSWPLVALGEYDGPLRDVLLTAKHDSRRDLSVFLHAAGRRLGALCFPTIATLPRGSLVRVWTVPAPSSHERKRRRAEIVPTVARAAATALSEALVRGSHPSDPCERPWPLPVRVVDALELRRGASGTAGKSARRRGQGRTGSMRLLRSPPGRTAVIILDDVSTTGATLREMVRLLGPAVLLAAVVAVAP